LISKLKGKGSLVDMGINGRAHENCGQGRYKTVRYDKVFDFFRVGYRGELFSVFLEILVFGYNK
jgi:hypothetical protein